MEKPAFPVKPRCKLFLSTDILEGAFGEGKWRLLEALRKEGTLVAAAHMLGRSYRKAWGDIRRAEQGLCCKLVEPSRGGPQKGKTDLTPFALQLLDAWKAYRNDVFKSVDKSFTRHIAGLVEKNCGACLPPEAGRTSP